jgi:RNA polymerase sigma-70 factor (sigma-E family)
MPLIQRILYSGWNFAGSSALYTCEMVPGETRCGHGMGELNTTSEEFGCRATSFSQEMADNYVRLIRLAYLLCGNWSAAEDLVAEAYARAWTPWSRGTVEELRAYTRRILVNLSVAGRRRAVLERQEAEREDGASAVAELADDVARRLDVTRALSELSPKLRVVAVLRYYEDLGEEEVARMLNIKVGTVKSRASRALDALRPLVEGEIRA